MTKVELTEEIKREVGQHFVVGFHGHELDDDIRTLIRDYHVGSVILMKRNVKDAIQVRRMLSELQSFAKECGHLQPLLIGSDQENGLVSAMSAPSGNAATQFPGAMALASTQSSELVEKVYSASGAELKKLGVHWAYAPVADVNSDMKNPVIGVRSFGDDAQQVAQYVAAAARGLTQAGIAPSAKHFPGHGDTHVDSHLALPRILKSMDQLNQTELIPFKRLLSDPTNIATIMTGHMALPIVNGNDDPCSLSRKITHDLLRVELGFRGVVVTDCLEMDAIADTTQGAVGVAEGTVRALEATADIAMICHTLDRQRSSIKATWEAIASGRLNRTEFTEGTARIRELKTRFVGSWADVVSPLKSDGFAEAWKTLKEKNHELSVATYKQTIAIIADPTNVLPLAAERILLFTPAIESLNKAVDDAEGVLRGKGNHIRNTAGSSFTAFHNAISQRSSCQHVVYSREDSTSSRINAIDDDVTTLVFVLRNADRATWQISELKRVLKLRDGLPLVIVASCTPYDLVGVSGLAKYVYIGTFEFTAQALEAAAGVIFGEFAASGRVPVTL